MKMCSKKQLPCTCGQNPQIQVRIQEAATGGVLLKKVFLKISQTSQENYCVGFNPATFLKRDSTQLSSCEICEVFRTSILKNIYERLFLESLGQNPVNLLKTNSAFGIFLEICLQIQQFVILKFPEHLVSRTPYNERMILVLLKTESLHYNLYNYRKRK